MTIIEALSRPVLTVLIILDGFGLNDPNDPGNAITLQTAPAIFEYMKIYPSTELAASGQAVGLFKGQQGNSEAGHLNIGTGRVVKQDLVQISDAIHDGTFFKNEAFKQALFHAKKYDTAVHLVGLLTDRNSAHAYPEHWYALLEYLRREGQEKVFLHLFTDGRDSSPHSAPYFLHELRGHMLRHEKIATMIGRFYAMDRNKNWGRTQAAYEAMVLGKGCTAPSAEEALSQAYNRGETDEYVCPTVITSPDGAPLATIQDNDAVFFFNARSDRARQLTKVFVQDHFRQMNARAFRRQRVPKNIRFVAMTDFGPDLPGVFTAFPSPDIPNALAGAIGDRYRQLYISETEKYAHVTYFLNGGYPQPLNGEKRELITSKRVHSFVHHPEMHAKEITDRILAYVRDQRYDFICVNYPNADMVGHTGNLEAAKRAIRVVDEQVKTLVETALAHDGQVVITADHGNAEVMVNPETHEVVTEHTTNPVPCIVIRKEMKGIDLRQGGALCDIAPTLLALMGLPQPKEMTGRSLLM